MDAGTCPFCEALQIDVNLYCFRVFPIPLLMRNFWRRQLLKAMYVYFVTKPGTKMWSLSQYSHLSNIFYLFPFKQAQTLVSTWNQLADLVNASTEVQHYDNLEKGHLLGVFICLTQQL
jgi:hypothetical protein